MGYSPKDIEKRHEEEKQRWIQIGMEKAAESQVNEQVEEGLIGGSTSFNVTSILPEKLKKGMIKGDKSIQAYIDWFLGGVFQEFLDDWLISRNLMGYGTEDATVSVSFKSKVEERKDMKEESKKKGKRGSTFEIPDLPPLPPIPPMPDVGGTIDEIMKKFERSMEKFSKGMEAWGAKIESWAEKLAHDIENKDDPKVREKWKKRGLDLDDIVVKTTGGKKSISVRKGAKVNVQELLKKRREDAEATKQRELRESGQTKPKRQPTRVEKKLSGLFGAISKELGRCKVKLGLANPPASESSEKKTHPVETKDRSPRGRSPRSGWG